MLAGELKELSESLRPTKREDTQERPVPSWSVYANVSEASPAAKEEEEEEEEQAQEQRIKASRLCWEECESLPSTEEEDSKAPEERIVPLWRACEKASEAPPAAEDEEEKARKQRIRALYPAWEPIDAPLKRLRSLFFNEEETNASQERSMPSWRDSEKPSEPLSATEAEEPRRPQERPVPSADWLSPSCGETAVLQERLNASQGFGGQTSYYPMYTRAEIQAHQDRWMSSGYNYGKPSAAFFQNTATAPKNPEPSKAVDVPRDERGEGPFELPAAADAATADEDTEPKITAQDVQDALEEVAPDAQEEAEQWDGAFEKMNAELQAQREGLARLREMVQKAIRKGEEQRESEVEETQGDEEAQAVGTEEREREEEAMRLPGTTVWEGTAPTYEGSWMERQGNHDYDHDEYGDGYDEYEGWYCGEEHEEGEWDEEGNRQWEGESEREYEGEYDGEDMEGWADRRRAKVEERWIETERSKWNPPETEEVKQAWEALQATDEELTGDDECEEREKEKVERGVERKLRPGEAFEW